MKKVWMLAAAFSFSLAGASTLLAAEETAPKTETKISGVLIDNHCGEDIAKKGDEAQKDAEAHKKGCALKCAKDGGLAIMSDGKLMKFDDASSKKAEEYLGEKNHGTKVTVVASKNSDGTLSVSEIKPVKAKKKDAAETK